MIWAFVRFVIALLVTAQAIRAQDDNPITNPQGGDTITAGTVYNITWTPTRGNIVSIEIWNEISLRSSFNGTNCHYDGFDVDCSLLIDNTTNSGSWLWHVPANAPVAGNYFLDIFVSDAGSDGPYYFMTNNFSISDVGSPTSTANDSPSVISTVTGTITASHSARFTGFPAGNSHASQTTTSQNGGLSSQALGGIIGAIVGSGLLIAASVGICFIVVRKRRTRGEEMKRLTPIPSGRTAEGSFVEEKEEPEAMIMDDLRRDGRKASGGIRYPDPDEDIVPSGRLGYS